MNSNDIEKQIEAILFYLAEPVKVSFIAKTLEVKVSEVLKALNDLDNSLANRGIKLINHDGEVSLVTSPDLAPLIDKLIKEERERDLGRAGIEALTIVAYKGPITRKEIEYIRGVNSQYALRNLLLRGLVEKNTDVDGKVVYTLTSDTIRFLGLSKITDLPEYLETNKQLEVTDQLKDQTEEE